MMICGIMIVAAITSDRLKSTAGCLFSDKFREEELSSYYHERRSFLKRSTRYTPIGFAAFIGDSRTEGLSVAAIDPQSVNLGISGDTSTGVLKRLSDYEPFAKWSYILFAIGYNDLKFRQNKEILHNFRTILEQVGDDTPVFILAIIPVDDSAGRSEFIRESYNTKIDEINFALKSMANSIENASFLNVNNSLSGADTRLATHLHIGDGIHLNEKGHAVLVRELRTAILDLR